jgi:hypothetical protein
MRRVKGALIFVFWVSGEEGLFVSFCLSQCVPTMFPSSSQGFLSTRLATYSKDNQPRSGTPYYYNPMAKVMRWKVFPMQTYSGLLGEPIRVCINATFQAKSTWHSHQNSVDSLPYVEVSLLHGIKMLLAFLTFTKRQ